MVSIATVVLGGPVPLALVAAGFLLEAAGTTPTVLVLFGIMLVGVAIGVASRAVRNVPDQRPWYAGQLTTE